MRCHRLCGARRSHARDRHPRAPRSGRSGARAAQRAAHAARTGPGGCHGPRRHHRREGEPAKDALPSVNVLVLGVLAGGCIGLGGLAITLVWVDGASTVGFGLNRVLGGLVFSIGLILVVLAGAEPFAGNNLAACVRQDPGHPVPHHHLRGRGLRALCSQHLLHPERLFVAGVPDVVARAALDLNHLSWSAFFAANLLPVTLGNTAGRGVFVGVRYWAAHLRRTGPA